MYKSASTCQNRDAPVSKEGNIEKLEVTVIPVDDEPYSKVISFSSTMMSTNQQTTPPQTNQSANSSAGQSQLQYPSLKNIFQAKESLWKPIFGQYVPANKLPLFSIFRKKITVKEDSKIQHPEGDEIGLHILFLKCDGNRFQRNAFANQLEVYCSTYFYGPLVIVYGQNSPPYKLHSFKTSYLLDRIQPLNEEEQKIYPLPYTAKKCQTVRNLMLEKDQKFTQDLDLHEKQMNVQEFMIYSYKTSFCPFINKKHEWSECNYAHRQQDFRRPPHLYFYYMDRCPNVAEDGSWDQCPDYLDCQYSHSLIEQLFSPLNYKLRPCPDRCASDKFQCTKRADLCCHNHSQEEKDRAIKALRNPPSVLPDHESMHDYLDLIEQEGLLNNVQEDLVQSPEIKNADQKQVKEQQTLNRTNSSSSKPPVSKKVTLAKLPEENKDGWAQLEQDMNKESQKKEFKIDQPGSEVLSPSPSKKMDQIGSNSQFIPNIQMVNDPFGNALSQMEKDYDKQVQAQAQIQQQPAPEEDYVQQFMKANVQNAGLGFGGNSSESKKITLNQSEQIKALKQKKGKKGKKAIKIQTINEQDNPSNRSKDEIGDEYLNKQKKLNSGSGIGEISDRKSIMSKQESQNSFAMINQMADQTYHINSQQLRAKGIIDNNSQYHIDDDEESQGQDNFYINRFVGDGDDFKSQYDDDNHHSFQTSSDQKQIEIDPKNKEGKQHRNTAMQSKIYEIDLQKVKSILEEDIVNHIYKNCEPSSNDKQYGSGNKQNAQLSNRKVENQKANANAKQTQPIVAQPMYSQNEQFIIKSAANTLLKQKIEQGDTKLILTNNEKYTEKSRFCMLQSSSSSSSEKDLGFGMQKKKINKNAFSSLNVPEESVMEDNQDMDQKSQSRRQEQNHENMIKIQDQDEMNSTEQEAEQDPYKNSLFSFDFLNDEKPQNQKEMPNEQQIPQKQMASKMQQQNAQVNNPEQKHQNQQQQFQKQAQNKVETKQQNINQKQRELLNQMKGKQINEGEKNFTQSNENQPVAFSPQKPFNIGSSSLQQQIDFGLNSNFHNFFTNDQIFGSPSPDSLNFFGTQNINQFDQSGSKIKVENHYNQHTTINNYDFRIQNSPKIIAQNIEKQGEVNQNFYQQTNFNQNVPQNQEEQQKQQQQTQERKTPPSQGEKISNPPPNVNDPDLMKFFSLAMSQAFNNPSQQHSNQQNNTNNNNVNNYINKNYFVVINQMAPQQTQNPNQSQSQQSNQGSSPPGDSQKEQPQQQNQYFAAYNQHMQAQQQNIINVFNVLQNQTQTSSQLNNNNNQQMNQPQNNKEGGSGDWSQFQQNAKVPGVNIPQKTENQQDANKSNESQHSSNTDQNQDENQFNTRDVAMGIFNNVMHENISGPSQHQSEMEHPPQGFDQQMNMRMEFGSYLDGGNNQFDNKSQSNQQNEIGKQGQNKGNQQYNSNNKYYFNKERNKHFQYQPRGTQQQSNYIMRGGNQSFRKQSNNNYEQQQISPIHRNQTNQFQQQQ